MDHTSSVSVNVKQAVPFFMVTDMEKSLEYYVNGLGFQMKNSWTPHGTIEWCWLELGGAALMLQEYRNDGVHAGKPVGKLGLGASVCFQCNDALAIYHEVTARGIVTKEPFVGNAMWDVALTDPDGYHIHFESSTDVPEETMYSAWKQQAS